MVSVLSVWVMYRIYYVDEYHSCITCTDGTQIFKKIFREETLQNHDRFILVLEEQVAVGLYYILTGSCSSQTKPIPPISYRTLQHGLCSLKTYLYLFSGVSYSPVLYHD